MENKINYNTRYFSKVIDRAMIACENSRHGVSDDFAEVSKIVEAGANSKPKMCNLFGIISLKYLFNVRTGTVIRGCAVPGIS